MTFNPRTEYQDLEIANRYDQQRFSSIPGKVCQWAEKRSIEPMIRLLPAGSWILDAPCGTGRLVGFFLGQNLKTLGGDISSEMLAVA